MADQTSLAVESRRPVRATRRRPSSCDARSDSGVHRMCSQWSQGDISPPCGGAGDRPTSHRCVVTSSHILTIEDAENNENPAPEWFSWRLLRCRRGGSVSGSSSSWPPIDRRVLCQVGWTRQVRGLELSALKSSPHAQLAFCHTAGPANTNLCVNDDCMREFDGCWFYGIENHCRHDAHHLVGFERQHSDCFNQMFWSCIQQFARRKRERDGQTSERV